MNDPHYTWDSEIERNLNFLNSNVRTGYCSHCEWIDLHPNTKLICETHDRRGKPHHVGNGKPKGLFAGTLTMSPSWGTNEEEMVTAIKGIFKQKTVPVKRYVWYLEYTENDLPHIHFIYETKTGGRITQQVFKRKWKFWDESTECGSGHKGGYHRHVAREGEYLDYISKDNGRHENRWTN